MPDLRITYKDATVDISAGLFHGPSLTLTCGAKVQVFEKEELASDLMPILYPAIKAWEAQGAVSSPGNIGSSSSSVPDTEAT